MEARFRRSYYPDYFCLEDILATQEKVPCKVETTIRGLGCLDPSLESEDLVVGSSVQLPFWLVSTLLHKRIQAVSVEIPKIYKESYREIFSADASIVDIRKMSLYFYEFGTHLLRLNHRDSIEINKMLINVFKDRVRVIMDWAQNLCTDASLIQKLDTLEKQLYQEGFKARTQLSTWLNDGSSKIPASEMVVNHKKRKRQKLCATIRRRMQTTLSPEASKGPSQKVPQKPEKNRVMMGAEGPVTRIVQLSFKID